MAIGSSRLLAGLLLLAAAAPLRADDLTRRQKGDLAIRARGVLAHHCAECHAGRTTAGESLLPVLDRAKVVAEDPPLPFVVPGDPDRSLLLHLVQDGSMPPGGRSRPSPDEVKALRDWVKAGAPGYPRAFDDRTTLDQVLNDLADQERENAERVPDLRYVSFAHLVRDGEKFPDLAAAEKRLAFALLQASEANVMPQPVDDSATLFRIDIGPLGWRAGSLFKVDSEDRNAKMPPDLVPYDLIALEYPFGFVPKPGDELVGRFDRFRKQVPQLRPVAFVRGDWLTDALVRNDEPTPLAKDLLRLKALATWNEKKVGGTRPAGPKARPFPKGEPVRVPAAGADEWQVPVVPLGAYYTRDVGAAKPQFDLEAGVAGMGGPLETVTEEDLFQIKVEVKRELYVLLLNVLADGSVRVIPVAGGADGGILVKPGGKPTYLRPKDEAGFKTRPLRAAAEEEFFVLLASPKPLPAPTVLVSEHARDQIWRFLPAAGPEGEPVVRKVLPLTVTGKKK
jgi:hypothetical protein